ncbi:hypothetical protein [Chitinolyticbacter meiyuanensis]|uniref:hypothetical protein n=1 Tax=Chitinolyticbacter meiyuanensis TaxID=682798 RepID=UPI001652AC2A|nr:hypothetical protein [Chitinolyticbacter meiyuanensis]
MYDCLSPEFKTAARLRTLAARPRHRRSLRLAASDLAGYATLAQAEATLAAHGFALERLADGSLLVFDLSVFTALDLQQRWPTLVGHYETPCRSTTPFAPS